MKTYQQFIQESKLRQITLGPSRSPFGRQRQQRDASERAAFRRSGMRRSRPGGNRIRFNAIRGDNNSTARGDNNSTAISSHANQTSYAKDAMPAKVDDKKNRVIPTRQRALFLKRLQRQIGNRSNRQVHAVDILPTKNFKKGDPGFMSRGREYHRDVKDIPNKIKSPEVKGKPGDIIAGKAAEVIPGSKDVEQGRKSRENTYTRNLGASRRDPITNIQVARVKG